MYEKFGSATGTESESTKGHSLQNQDEIDQEIAVRWKDPSQDAEQIEMELGNKNLFRKASQFFEYDPKLDELEDELGFSDPSQPPTKGCNFEFLQWRIRRVVEHMLVRILTAVLIIVDIVIVIVDLFNEPTDDDSIEKWSLALSIYFLIEVSLRMFGLGPRYYFSKWYNSLDFILVLVTLIISIVSVSVVKFGSNPASLLVVLRMIRLIRITRIISQKKMLQTGVRQFVSQNKRRYQRNGFDLDLTYISPVIIAMSFPSSGKRTLYRNDIKEVSRFFNTLHKDQYLIYNLCSERDYDTSYFNENVERYKVDDHNVPSLEMMLDFSESVKRWMQQDEENVIAVHCKGGKGRTGTMICIVLIDNEQFHDADQCLGYFGDRRTDKNAGRKFQGVETPSQSRYVGYYEKMVKMNRIIPEATPLMIISFTINGLKKIGKGDGSDFTISVKSRTQTAPADHIIVSQQKSCQVLVSPEEVTIKMTNPVKVQGDTKVMFLSKNRRIPKGYDDCPFYFWFHTAFISENRLVLRRHELDNPHKSKLWHLYGEKFMVTVHFASPSSKNESRIS